MEKVKLVILKFLGDFLSGFYITLDVSNEGEPPYQTMTGRLPSDGAIISVAQKWSKIYQSRCNPCRISLVSSRNINIDSLNQDLHQKSSYLVQNFNNWLKSEDFSRITDCLNKFNSREEIRVLISSNCRELRRLPWHLWDLLVKYSQAEVALSIPDTELGHRKIFEKTRILIVLGDSTNINVEVDRQLLTRYCNNAELTILKEPSREELIHHLHSELGWDILFYSGHSTERLIYINKNDNLNIVDLRSALRTAIETRLKIAIFNSCDGLEIASELEKLNIPQLIVMREPVPDIVAQVFLKSFLQEYTSGSSLYISVKKAREELRKLEDKFPCASWLPVIVQHQLETPPTW